MQIQSFHMLCTYMDTLILARFLLSHTPLASSHTHSSLLDPGASVLFSASFSVRRDTSLQPAPTCTPSLTSVFSRSCSTCPSNSPLLCVVCYVMCLKPVVQCVSLSLFLCEPLASHPTPSLSPPLPAILSSPCYLHLPAFPRFFSPSLPFYSIPFSKISLSFFL